MIEEEVNIKFVDWGKLKPEHDKNDIIVIKMGESKEFDITNIVEEKEDNELKQVKFRLKMDGEEKEILMWSNASILRQYKTLELKEGDHIEVTYVEDYETSYGNKGREIKIRKAK